MFESFSLADPESPEGPVISGLVSGTRVATAMGWQPVERVCAGDRVLTFDAGLQAVTQVTRHGFSGPGDCPKAFWPIEVPEGVLGNREVMHLMPQQTIMVESDTAEDLYGDPFSLLPAEAMDALTESHRVPPQDGFEVVRLHFATEQVVFARDGLLFLCPSSRDMVAAAWEAPQDPLYAILPLDEARFLAGRIELEAACAVEAESEGCMAGLPA
ncbi:Hint domain-containing protein [Roseovarius sp.]|uniref:Hint domain-containing protein n=1 Tax=Roseovarius sp. TaxID=1486281 RepID=UPI0026370C94|nr:Hint domain-containing protein [Roseovarius sp.]MDM8168653.1 Hint domain-containing protein [Roseovarius sp.]